MALFRATGMRIVRDVEKEKTCYCGVPADGEWEMRSNKP
jgi:hypothetical protein